MGDLVVTLMCVDDRKAAKIKFSEVLGFRLLDEGNLLEFWEFCKGGWIFLVKKNGWFDLEATRAGFLLDRNLKLSEFFIAGENDCLSIISGENPVIEIFSI